jgi:hypothetical protein
LAELPLLQLTRLYSFLTIVPSAATSKIWVVAVAAATTTGIDGDGVAAPTSGLLLLTFLFSSSRSQTTYLTNKDAAAATGLLLLPLAPLARRPLR